MFDPPLVFYFVSILYQSQGMTFEPVALFSKMKRTV